MLYHLFCINWKQTNIFLRNTMHHYHYTRKYRGPARSICNLKYNVPKQISIVFHNGSNDGYYFIIKQQTEEFEWQFTCLRENTEKYITFSLLVKKEVTRIAKNGKEITKPHLADYKILKAQVYYQILLIILLKEFIKLDIEMNMITKNVKRVEWNIKITTVFLNTQTLEIIFRNNRIKMFML